MDTLPEQRGTQPRPEVPQRTRREVLTDVGIASAGVLITGASVYDSGRENKSNLSSWADILGVSVRMVIATLGIMRMVVLRGNSQNMPPQEPPTLHGK